MDLGWAGLVNFVFFQVEQDRADFTVYGYTCQFARLRVANCLTINWNYQRLYTQYPMEASKFWNLLGLFTPESWSWIIGTLFLVISTFKISTYMGKKLGIETRSVEIILVPYRFVASQITENKNKLFVIFVCIVYNFILYCNNPLLI